MSSKHFHKLKVKDISKSTEDCSIISFDVPSEIQSHFAYKQGQYLTLEANINNEEVRRSYSLCSSPLDNEWKVGIKKIEGGIFSSFVNDELAIGDTLDVMPPDGSFFVELDPKASRNYVAFAAGSGITPILSIVKTHLSAEPKSRFKLFYTNKTVSSIILKEELEALKNQFMERFEVFYFLTKQKRSIPFLNGRLDKEKLDIIFSGICNIPNVDHFFSCGPEEMILLIKDYLTSKNVNSSSIHYELFTSSGNQMRKEELKIELKGKVSNVTIREGGKILSFDMVQGSNNILDEALNNNADLPFACKGGVCATCKAKIIEGQVEMPVHYGLEDEEIEQGFVLTCQSIPVSDKLIIDFDV